MNQVESQDKIKKFCEVFEIPHTYNHVTNTWTFFPNNPGYSQTLKYNFEKFIYQDEDGVRKEFTSLKFALIAIVSA